MRAQHTFGCTLFISAAILAGLSGCTSANQPSTVAAAGDPANGNLAPADSSEPAQVTPVPRTMPTQSAYNPAPPPPNYSAPAADYDSQYDQNSTDQGSGSNQTLYATQPPPAIPDYSQPACPGENYIWTPGNWSYSASDYYWVPGAWVLAPYTGALWTPPYWEFYENRYRRHGGYWGAHIGFYGGINYGFGYVGRGYYGGYWQGGSFAYNRSVTNVNVNVVRNVYNYRVSNVTNTRVSYNGGPGGVNVRPTASEMAVVHEQRMAPVAAQTALVRQSAENRQQFAGANHGRPAEIAMQKPLQTSYRAPAAQPSAVEGHPKVFAPAPRPEAPRNEAPRAAPVEMRAQSRPEVAPQQPGHPAAEVQARPETMRGPLPAAQQGRPEPFRPAQQAAPAQRMEPARPQPAQRMETPRPAPAQRREAPRQMPQPTQRMEAPRPAPAPHVEAARPAPAPRAEAPRPAPHAEAPRQAPAPHVEAPRPAPHAAPPAPHAAPPHPEGRGPEKHP